VTEIKNSKTKFTPPVVPIVGIRPSVRTKPDIMLVTSGTAEEQGDDLIVVTAKGPTTVGSCVYGGAIIGPSATSATRVGLSFYTSKFSGGTQVGITDNSYEQGWKWVVTEK